MAAHTRVTSHSRGMRFASPYCSTSRSTSFRISLWWLWLLLRCGEATGSRYDGSDELTRENAFAGRRNESFA